MIETNKQKEARLVDWVMYIHNNSEKYGYEVIEINRHQIRLVKDRICVDIYPKGMKYCDIPNEKWGEIESLNAFLNKIFIANHSDCATPSLDLLDTYECGSMSINTPSLTIENNVLYVNGERYGPMKSATFIFDGNVEFMKGQSTTIEF